MHYFKQFFQTSKTKLSTELCEVRTATATSPLETATCATPNQARRIIKTSDGNELVLAADDVKYLEVIHNMFENLKGLNGIDQTPTILIPIAIDSVVMQQIIDWNRAAKNNCNIHFEDFFKNITIQQCIKLIQASLFLEIKLLSEHAAKWIAAKLEGKSSGEMAEILGIPYEGLSGDKKAKIENIKRNLMPDNIIVISE